MKGNLCDQFFYSHDLLYELIEMDQTSPLIQEF